MDKKLEVLIEIRKLVEELIKMRESEIINEIDVVDTTFTNGNDIHRGLLE